MSGLDRRLTNLEDASGMGLPTLIVVGDLGDNEIEIELARLRAAGEISADVTVIRTWVPRSDGRAVILNRQQLYENKSE